MSYKIVTINGIDIELHLFFIIFVLGLLLVDPMTSLFLVIIFSFVAMHELSHSLVAKRNGINVRRILLLPIGGVAVIDGMEMDPVKEIKMALAGPLFNFAMALLLVAFAKAMGFPVLEWLGIFLESGELALLPTIYIYALYANIILGAFNLFVPAFPLDGGRVLRAVLALKLDYIRATKYAKTVSLIISGLMFLGALYAGDLWIMIIAFFIAIGATGEYEAAKMQRSMKRTSIKGAISPDFLAFSERDSISKAIQQMVTHNQRYGVILGESLHYADIADAARVPNLRWNGTPISRVGKSLPVLPPEADMNSLAIAFRKHRTPLVAVGKDHELMGVIRLSDLKKRAVA